MKILTSFFRASPPFFEIRLKNKKGEGAGYSPVTFPIVLEILRLKAWLFHAQLLMLNSIDP